MTLRSPVAILTVAVLTTLFTAVGAPTARAATPATPTPGPTPCDATAPSELIATPGDGRVDLQWTASTSHSDTIIDYRITVSPVDPPTSYTQPATKPRTTTISNLTNGTTYYFSIVAETATCASSATSTAATPHGASPSPDPSPSPSPVAASPRPTPSPVATPQGQLNLSEASAPPLGNITISGIGLPPSTAVNVFLDTPDHQLASLTTGADGSFSQLVTVPDATAAGDHRICATPTGGAPICASIAVTPAPIPSPTDGSSAGLLPGPASDPSPSPLPGLRIVHPSSGGALALGFLTRPPFLYLPALLLLAILAAIATWAWRRRPGPPVADVQVTHRASQPSPEYRPAAASVATAAAAGMSPVAPEPVPPPLPRPLGIPIPPPPTGHRRLMPPELRPSPPGADVPPDYPQPSD